MIARDWAQVMTTYYSPFPKRNIQNVANIYNSKTIFKTA